MTGPISVQPQITRFGGQSDKKTEALALLENARYTSGANALLLVGGEQSDKSKLAREIAQAKGQERPLVIDGRHVEGYYGGKPVPDSFEKAPAGEVVILDNLDALKSTQGKARVLNLLDTADRDTAFIATAQDADAVDPVIKSRIARTLDVTA